MRANPTQHTREREISHNDLDGFLVFAHLDHGHIALHIEIGRTRLPAGRPIKLLDGVSAWNGLSVLLVGGLSGCQPFIVGAGQFYRADFRTVATGGTFIEINITGSFADFDLEVSRATIYLFQIGTGEQLYVGVPADLDQFRRNNSHRAIVGGEGLVQLGHYPANG
jgi:hypothetical protein